MTGERMMSLPKIVTREEWLVARKELLAREKQFDHERDKLTENAANPRCQRNSRS